MNKLACCAALMLLFTAMAPPESGLWLTQDHTGVFSISVCGTDQLCGTLIGIARAHPDDPAPKDRWGRPECGEVLIRMPRLGDDGRWHGTILDPRSGANWSAELWRSGQGLRLRGYLGVPLFGDTQLWTPFHGDTQQDCRFAEAANGTSE